MNADQLRRMQAPLKERFRARPEDALATLTARGTLDVAGVACQVTEDQGAVRTTGLHPLTGGSGAEACSANMLLEALVGCAGVTMSAVATALGIGVENGTLAAHGDLDFRGTLGISREVPAGFIAIRLEAALRTSATDEELSKLAQLTERYCVVARSLNCPLTLTISRS